MNDGFLSQEEIDALLKGGGDSATPEPVAAELSEMEQDALGEIGNISMGSAATTLSVLLGRRVSITTPKVEVITFENIKNKIAATRSKSKYAASNIASIMSGICGLYVFSFILNSAPLLPIDYIKNNFL